MLDWTTAQQAARILDVHRHLLLIVDVIFDSIQSLRFYSFHAVAICPQLATPIFLSKFRMLFEEFSCRDTFEHLCNP